jgi:hypothetical protein
MDKSHLGWIVFGSCCFLSRFLKTYVSKSLFNLTMLIVNLDDCLLKSKSRIFLIQFLMQILLTTMQSIVGHMISTSSLSQRLGGL